MQVPYDEGVAIHIGPESCAVAREGLGEALPTAAFIGNRRIQQNQVQVGVDYRFDLFAPPPVVSKY